MNRLGALRRVLWIDQSTSVATRGAARRSALLCATPPLTDSPADGRTDGRYEGGTKDAIDEATHRQLCAEQQRL
jgi:hypothetical protein